MTDVKPSTWQRACPVGNSDQVFALSAPSQHSGQKAQQFWYVSTHPYAAALPSPQSLNAEEGQTECIG